MKKLLRIVLFAILGISFINTVKAQEKSSLEGKTILFVYGGWDGHDPKPCHDLLAPWMESEGAKVISSDSLGDYEERHQMGCKCRVIIS